MAHVLIPFYFSHLTWDDHDDDPNSSDVCFFFGPRRRLPQRLQNQVCRIGRCWCDPLFQMSSWHLGACCERRKGLMQNKAAVQCPRCSGLVLGCERLNAIQFNLSKQPYQHQGQMAKAQDLQVRNWSQRACGNQGRGINAPSMSSMPTQPVEAKRWCMCEPSCCKVFSTALCCSNVSHQILAQLAQERDLLDLG